MTPRPPTLVQMGALVFILLFQESLLYAWRFSPLDRGGWIALLIWLSPILLYRLGKLPSPGRRSGDPLSLLILGLICTILGIIASVNSLKTLGLAFACASFLPWHAASLLWLMSAFCWMTPFSYVGSYYLGSYIFLSRLLFLTPCTALLLWYMRGEREEKRHEVS
ncbi:MAG: hypothetical protein KDK78_08300 [Chlamydiia bacterium]|nr:hypothetical protein [Chlamydiia bacterium]